ncbi:protein odr-4 homolog [Procambarus clarkii]|uniref:protein odr-4 homolog n=1 Tax=Procambarus clarkii TaxID=6728 RepID=UPI001E673A5E|nr:protein odr-4 homolog [Procambarus clarkii]
MGRTVVAEDSLQDKLTALAKAGIFQIGLVIGQNAKDRDFIVHLAPTPIPDEGDLSSEEEEAIPSSKTGQAKPKYPDSIAKVVDTNVSQHTRQVVRMLPGGLDIIGIYVVTPQAEFSSSVSQSKLRSVLTVTHKTASRILLDTAEIRTEKIIIHVCTQTFKVMCKTVDVCPSAPSLQSNAELKFQRGGIKWQQLSFSYNINLNFWLPKDNSSHSLYKTILTLIKPWANNVKESLILIDSELPNDEDPLDSSADEKPKKKGSSRGMMELAPPKVFKAEILDSGSPVASTRGLTESSGCVRLSGTLAGLAFVHSKATVGEARSAVLVDLVRSVMARWEMHCDSLIEEPPSHLTGPIIHEPPRRVFLEGGGLPVSLCDYLFPGDTCADACQSAKELLGVRVRKEHVDDTLETHADASEVMDMSNADAEGVKHLDGNGSSREQSCSVTYILLAIVIALVGIGVSYITFRGTKALT